MRELLRACSHIQTTPPAMNRTPRNDTFRREILLILALKFALIYGLWYAFFSQPLDRELTDESVGAYFLTPPDHESSKTNPNGDQ